MTVVAVIPIAKGQWESTGNSEEWVGMYFFEVVLDWSLFKGCKGKLYVETMHSDSIKEGGWLRLAYQQMPSEFIPVEGSTIKTRVTSPARWELLESDWFELPEEPGVSCLWIQGKAEPDKRISVALATLVVVNE